MKKITTALFMACALMLCIGCKKNTYVPPATSANALLIVATYTAVKIEGSNINNATDWADITQAGAREVLTIKSDQTFISATSNPTTGATATPIIGKWYLSTDGNTLSYIGVQDYTIAELTSTRMVMVLKGPNK